MPWLATTWPSILVAPTFVVSFLVLSAALGRRILRTLGAAGGDTAERALAATGLGAGALQFVPFALGVAGILSETSLRIALALVALALFTDVRAVLAPIFLWLKAPRKPPSALLLWSAAVAPGVVIAGLVALVPAIDPDGLSYHLMVPKRWIHAGSLVYLPTYSHSNTPMGIELLFGIALVLGGDVPAKFLHFVLGVGAALGLFLAGRRLNNPAAGVVAAVLYLVGPAGVVLLLGAAYLEGVIAYAIVASTLSWLIWFRTRDIGWLRAAALLAGLSVSFKLTAVLFGVGLAAVTLLALWEEAGGQPQAVRRNLRILLGLVPLVAGPVLPWLARSAVVTGNPFFPLFASVIPTRDYSPAIAQAFENYNRYFLWGSGRLAGFTIDQRRLVLVAVAALFAACAAAIFFRLRSRLERGATLVVLGVMLLQLSAAGLYARYWMPVASVLTLLLACLFVRPVRRRWLRGALVLCTLVAALLRARGPLAEIKHDVANLTLTAAGLRSQRDFALAYLPLFPLYEHANRDLPPDAVIALSYYCGGGFHLDRTTVCAEFQQDSLRLTSWADFSSDIARLGVTHVIAPRTLAEGGPPPPIDPVAPTQFRRNEDEFFARLLRARGTLLASASDQGLYVLARKP